MLHLLVQVKSAQNSVRPIINGRNFAATEFSLCLVTTALPAGELSKL